MEFFFCLLFPSLRSADACSCVPRKSQATASDSAVGDGLEATVVSLKPDLVHISTGTFSKEALTCQCTLVSRFMSTNVPFPSKPHGQLGLNRLKKKETLSLRQ